MNSFTDFFKSIGLFVTHRFLPFLKNYIKSKRFGYYAGLVASLFLLIFGFMFLAVYGKSIYMDSKIVAFPILGALIYIALSFYRPIEGAGAIIQLFGATGGFCAFALKTYPYLSEVFYGGFNAQSFAALKIEYLLLFIFILVALIFSFISVFTKKSVELTKEVEVLE